MQSTSRRLLSSTRQISLLQRQIIPAQSSIYATAQKCYFHSNTVLNSISEEAENIIEDLDAMRRYLLLTSRNRGRLETELFLGGYAQHEDRIWNMTREELELYNEVLDYTDNELFEYIIGQKETPQELAVNIEYQRVVQYVNTKKEHYTRRQHGTFDVDYTRNDCAPPSLRGGEKV